MFPSGVLLTAYISSQPQPPVARNLITEYHGKMSHVQVPRAISPAVRRNMDVLFSDVPVISPGGGKPIQGDGAHDKVWDAAWRTAKKNLIDFEHATGTRPSVIPMRGYDNDTLHGILLTDWNLDKAVTMAEVLLFRFLMRHTIVSGLNVTVGATAQILAHNRLDFIAARTQNIAVKNKYYQPTGEQVLSEQAREVLRLWSFHPQRQMVEVLKRLYRIEKDHTAVLWAWLAGWQVLNYIGPGDNDTEIVKAMTALGYAEYNEIAQNCLRLQEIPFDHVIKMYHAGCTRTDDIVEGYLHGIDHDLMSALRG